MTLVTSPNICVNDLEKSLTKMEDTKDTTHSVTAETKKVLTDPAHSVLSMEQLVELRANAEIILAASGQAPAKLPLTTPQERSQQEWTRKLDELLKSQQTITKDLDVLKGIAGMGNVIPGFLNGMPVGTLPALQGYPQPAFTPRAGGGRYPSAGRGFQPRGSGGGPPRWSRSNAIPGQTAQPPAPRNAQPAIRAAGKPEVASGATMPQDVIPVWTCHHCGCPGHFIRDCWRRNGMMFCPPCSAHHDKLVMKEGQMDCYACIILDGQGYNEVFYQNLLAEIGEA